MNKDRFSRMLPVNAIEINDAFWKEKQKLVREEVIPYQWDALNDRIPDAAPSFCMHNFRAAVQLNQRRMTEKEKYQPPVYSYRGFERLPEKDGELKEDEFYGFVFQDSDFYKWIEAVGYSLMQHSDAGLEATADEAIEIVAAAQQPDGYLDTYYILNGQDQIFANLRDFHELYCLGHLIEGAIAYYQATGKNRLLQVACRYADYAAGKLGADQGMKRGYPGHEIAEMALIQLYEVTGEKRYLELARFFINERGRQPFYFDSEKHEGVDLQNPLRYSYHQAHLPVRQQTEAVGHAVRAVYLYSGMAELARVDEDESLLKACRTLWDSITGRKMYITGGIGGTHIGESFSFDYDLPSDTAYAETCASIGLIFFAGRMLQLEADARYADVMETALYNGVLSGIALDGKSFFYVNPLSVDPVACHKDERKAHVQPVRQKWFGCACCPPNLARLIGSVGRYAYTADENTLYVHLYIGSTFRLQTSAGEVTVEIRSGFPYDGKVSVKIGGEGAASGKWTLALRIPGWCREWKGNGIPLEDARVEKGYLYITRSWNPGETLELDFPMEIRLMQSSPLVRETAGQLAVTRGPVVYCLEEKDNGHSLHLLSIGCDAKLRTEPFAIEGEQVPAVLADGWREKQQPDAENALYCEAVPTEYEPVQLKFGPYYTWANRGENEMTVWVNRRK